MRGLTRRRLGVVITFVGLAGVAVGLSASPVSATVGPDVQPVILEQTSNLNCSDLDDAYGQTWLEIDVEPGNGTTGPITITNFDGEARTFDWSSTIGIDAVYVKGGSGGSNLYVYAAGANAAESFGDDGLTTPGQNGNGVSHMSFCYDVTDATTTTIAPTTSQPPTSSTTPRTPTTVGPTTTTLPDSTTTTVAPTSTVAPTTSSTSPAQVLGSSTIRPTTPTTAAQVLGATQTRPLPRTGADSTPLIVLSLAAIIAGLGLIVLGKAGPLRPYRRR